MCTISSFDFCQKSFTRKDIAAKKIIEVGSFNVNGSLRQFFEKYQPQKYLGVDIAAGPGVDQICRAEKLTATFGKNSFDILIATEVIEHIKDWRLAIHNFKQILKPSGLIFIATRSKGFRYHGYPHDYWRYEISDFRTIFSDFRIKHLQKDNFEPGVFIKAQKPKNFTENNLENHQLYSIILKKRVDRISLLDSLLFQMKFIILRSIFNKSPKFLKSAVANFLPKPIKKTLHAILWRR